MRFFTFNHIYPLIETFHFRSVLLCCSDYRMIPKPLYYSSFFLTGFINQKEAYMRFSEYSGSCNNGTTRYICNKIGWFVASYIYIYTYSKSVYVQRFTSEYTPLPVAYMRREILLDLNFAAPSRHESKPRLSSLSRVPTVENTQPVCALPENKPGTPCPCGKRRHSIASTR